MTARAQTVLPETILHVFSERYVNKHIEIDKTISIMRTVALISGGKDSCFNMMQCIAEGHEIVALANLQPLDKDELDSYMYQTVGHHAIELYAEAMELPLYRHTIQGTSKQTDKVYTPTQDDEVEDLLLLLQKVKEHVDFEAVSVGAILSDYQRVRVENVCQRLGITSLAYLWRRDQSELLEEMVKCGVSAVIIKVASWGLDPDKHLGKNIREMLPELRRMSEKYQLNICGEGGEYETFTLDCPLFKKKIVLDEVQQVIHSTDPYSPVGYLNLRSAHLEDKPGEENKSQREMIEKLVMKRSSDIQKDLMCDTGVPTDPLRSFSDPPLSSTDPPVSSSTDLPLPSESNNMLPVDHPILVTVKGDNLYISGVMAYCSEEQDIKETTAAAMDRLRDRITELGDDWNISQLVLVYLYVQKMEDFAQINSVYTAYFGVNPPTRVCVQACLPRNVLLQIDCYGCKNDRSTMHVQSISHWASANIGPYSQAIQIDNRIYVAGQIALVPGSMKIIEGGVSYETRLALRHADRILVAKSAGCSVCNCVLAVCYVTSSRYIHRMKQEWNALLKFKTDEEISCRQLGVLYVVVPRLPRNALVEWQLVAYTCSQAVTEHITSQQDRGYTTVVTSRTTDTSEIHYTAFTEFSESSLKPVSMEDAVCSFCACHRKAVQGFLRKTVLRIFYKTSIFNYELLHKCFTDQLFDEDGHVEAFALVPVISLCNSSTVLAACQ